MTITVNAAAIKEASSKLSNWGRWGKDDQIGVLNLITPEKRAQAMALAKKGVVVSMQRKSTLMKAPPVQAGTDEPQGVMFYEVRFRAIPPGDLEHNDGFSGEEGTFTICSFWLVTALAMIAKPSARTPCCACWRMFGSNSLFRPKVACSPT